MSIDSSDIKASDPPFPALVIAVISTMIGVAVAVTLGIVYLPGVPHFNNDLAMVLGTGLTAAIITACAIGVTVTVRRDIAKMRRGNWP